MDTDLKQSKIRLDKVSSTFCLAKWNQATLHLFNGHTQSCHHVNSHSVDLKALAGSPSALHNTKAKEKARKQMSLGVRPQECAYCWKIEDKGQISDRIFKSREDWAEVDHEEVASEPLQRQQPPRYLEVAFDNICNFKCLYCSPSYSSSWRSEIEKYGAYPTSRRYNNLLIPKLKKQLPRSQNEQSVLKNAFWNWWPELQNHLHYLRVTGGEPLLTKDTWTLLDSLATKDLRQLNFAINSNLGVPQKLVLDLISRLNRASPNLKSTTLYASIDCLGPQAEYIRYGLDESLFWNNVKLCLEQVKPPFTFSFMVTVNALSLAKLPELLKRIVELRKQFPEHHIAFDTPYLRNPEHLSIQILPPAFATYLDGAIRILENEPIVAADEVVKLQRLRKLINENPWNGLKKTWMRRDFFLMIRECDKRRDLDFKKSFPEMVDFYESCSKDAKKWPRFLF